MMRLQLESQKASDYGPNDVVFSPKVVKKKQAVTIGSVVTKYNITLTDDSRFKMEQRARQLRVMRLQKKTCCFKMIGRGNRKRINGCGEGSSRNGKCHRIGGGGGGGGQ